MEKQKRAAGRVRMFLLAFGLSFLLLGALGGLVVYLLDPGDPPPPSGEVTPDSFYLPREEDDLTILWAVRPDGADTPAFFLLARLDMLAGRIPVAAFPAATALGDGGDFASLEEAYRSGGAAKAAQALGNAYAFPIDRWADWEGSDIQSAVDRMGVLEYQLDQPLLYERDGDFISLEEGRQLVGGRAFWDILRFPAYPGGPAQQCEEAARLVAAYLDHRLTALLGESGPSLAAGLLDLGETDLSYLDYESRLPALDFLSRLKEAPAEVCVVSGGWNQAGIFVPDPAARRRLVQLFA